MTLPSDITLYFKLFSFEELNSKYIYPLTDDLNSLVGSIKTDREMIGLVLLKKDTPILYSPYMIDFGPANTKEVLPLMLPTFFPPFCSIKVLYSSRL